MPRVDPSKSERRRPDGLTLVQYWDSKEIPSYLTDELGTFTELNPNFRHLVFDRTAALDFIADHFTSREVKAFRSCAVPSMQSDYFRFCAGLVFKGIYADVDYRCITPLASAVPHEDVIRLFRGPKGNVISGFYAFRAPGHPFLELALEIITANIERRYPDNVHFATGPPIFMALVVLHLVGSDDGSIAPIRNPPLQKAVRSYWEVIGSRSRVKSALRDVEVRSAREYAEYVSPSGPLPYKSTEAHWLNSKGDIFAFR